MNENVLNLRLFAKIKLLTFYLHFICSLLNLTNCPNIVTGSGTLSTIPQSGPLFEGSHSRAVHSHVDADEKHQGGAGCWCDCCCYMWREL